MQFRGDKAFADAGNLFLAKTWQRLCPGIALPSDWTRWGYQNGDQGEFSLRVALDTMQLRMPVRECGEVIAA